jgi:hypothetical protein
MDMVPDDDTGMLNSLGASTRNGVLRRSKRVKRTFLKGRGGTIAAFTDVSCCREAKPDGGPMSARGHSRPGRASSKSGHVRYILPERPGTTNSPQLSGVHRACIDPKLAAY